MMNSILNINVSCFQNYSKPNNPKTINLLTWLKSTKYSKVVDNIRRETSKRKINYLKSKLPAITPSGIFTQRNNKSIISYSGLICIDIDFKDNSHIYKFNELKNELCKLPEVAYCGISVSGKGYFLLIPLKYPEKHFCHFLMLKQAFESIGITIDNTHDISRLRGYSIDPDAYFNHNAQLFTKVLNKTENLENIKTLNDFNSEINNSNSGIALQLINLIRSKQVDITTTYEAWFQCGCVIANIFGENGRNLFHQISCFYPKYNVVRTDKQYNHCLKSGSNAGIGTLIYWLKNAGVMLKKFN